MSAPDEHERRWDEQAEVFGRVYERVETLLARFGRPDFLNGQSYGDYQVPSDYLGNPEVVIFVDNLKMLQPPIIYELQRLIREFPGWQITVTVAPREHENEWPNMGLYVRPHEIIDGLQRQHFPEEFQSLEYEGARRGTAYD